MQRYHPLANCYECTLFGENAYVPSDGPESAEVAVLAEAPGFEETRQGRPLVGDSGRLLAPVLNHHNLLRKNLLVTNCVQCRPPENRNPSKLEIECCRPRLEHDLRHAKTVIALGNFAAQALVPGKVGITKLRVGPPKSGFIGDREVKVIPTWHPAYCLRVPDSFPQLVSDVGKIRVAERPPVQPPNYRVFEDPRQAAQALQQLQKYPKVVLDIETGLEKDEDFDHANELLCVGFSYAPGKAIVVADSALLPGSPARVEWAKLMRSVRKTAHNGKFDLPGTVPTIGFLPTLDEDTLLSSYAKDERKGIHGLKYRAREELGYPEWEAAIAPAKKGAGFESIERKLLYEYNAWDNCATWDLEEYDAKTMNDTQKGLYRHLINVSNALMKVEMDGIKVDEVYLDKLSTQLQEGLHQMEVGLSRWVENPRSHVQVMAALKKLGPKPKDTAAPTLALTLQKGSTSTEARDFIQRLLDYRKDFKTFSTYVEGARTRLRGGRIYPTYLIHGTVTGRLSCRNPNLQNLTRGSVVRDLYIPDDGSVFVAADYKAIELRVEACLAQEALLADLFNSGADVHDVFTQRLYGGNFKQEQRSVVKTFIYGSAYGEEPRSTAGRLGIPMDTAVRIHHQLGQLMPSVRAYQADIKRRVLAGEDLTTPFGRTRHNYLITDKNRKDIVKESWAFEPQSIANDICLHSLIRLSNAGLDIRTTTHDSIMVECKREEAIEVGKFMQDTMERTAREVYSDFVPFPVDLKIGESWGQC